MGPFVFSYYCLISALQWTFTSSSRSLKFRLAMRFPRDWAKIIFWNVPIFSSCVSLLQNFLKYELPFAPRWPVPFMSGRKAVLNRVTLLRDRFRAQDEEDYENGRERELCSACAWTSVILAGKLDSRRHSTTGFSENAVAAKISSSNGSFIIWRLGEYIHTLLLPPQSGFSGTMITLHYL